jgi:endonuclease/exonuclease/phosphatase family metal-dependent hydrolase
VEIDIGKTMLQVLNTHLGLRRSERLVQVQALLGRDWLGNRDIRSPTVLCGDLNALPTSLAYQKMRQLLRDAQMMVADWRPRATWPARWPIGRIDHVFVSPEVTVTEVRIFDGGLACVASDHRPLLASLEVRPPPARDE